MTQAAETHAMSAVTISREYGSGGGEVATRLAAKLGWQLVDHEIVAQIAERLDITVEEAEAQDEHADSFVSRLLVSMQLASPEIPAPFTQPVVRTERMYREALRQVVDAAVTARHVVIVGRASQILLADHRDALHVRIVAPLEQRIAYVANREQLNDADARARISMKDRDRAYYIQTQFHRNPDDPHLYDIVLNTGMLSLDAVVDLVCRALSYKAQRLQIPEDQLGPGTGLPPYSSAPADIRPPGIETSDGPPGDTQTSGYV